MGCCRPACSVHSSAGDDADLTGGDLVDEIAAVAGAQPGARVRACVAIPPDVNVGAQRPPELPASCAARIPLGTLRRAYARAVPAVGAALPGMPHDQPRGRASAAPGAGACHPPAAHATLPGTYRAPQCPGCTSQRRASQLRGAHPDRTAVQGSRAARRRTRPPPVGERAALTAPFGDGPATPGMGSVGTVVMDAHVSAVARGASRPPR